MNKKNKKGREDVKEFYLQFTYNWCYCWIILRRNKIGLLIKNIPVLILYMNRINLCGLFTQKSDDSVKCKGTKNIT